MKTAVIVFPGSNCDRDMWNGLEQLGFFVLFPALLFITLAKAEFSGIDAGAIALGSIGSVTFIALVLILCWPLFRAVHVSGASYTTVFQTSTRWNAFIALAIDVGEHAEPVGEMKRMPMKSLMMLRSSLHSCWLN